MTGTFGDGIESPYFFSAALLSLAAATCLVIMSCFSVFVLTVAHFVMACCFVFLAFLAACVNLAGNRVYCAGRPDGDPCQLSRKAKFGTFVFALVAAGLTLGFGIACWESPVFGEQPCYALNTAAVVFEWTLVLQVCRVLLLVTFKGLNYCLPFIYLVYYFVVRPFYGAVIS